MRHRMAVAVVVAFLLAALLAVAVYAAFPQPPGVACPVPDPGTPMYTLTAADHSQVSVGYPLSGGGFGTITTGCLLSQDQVTVWVDGPRSSYVLNVTQYVVHVVERQIVVNNTTATTFSNAWSDVVHGKPILVSATPWSGWTSVTYSLPPASDERTVSISLYTPGTNATLPANIEMNWTFLHLTPSSLLPVAGNLGAAWSVGIELFLVGVVTATGGYFMGRFTIRRLGVRPNMSKVLRALVLGVVYYLFLLYWDWSGVMWNLGGLSSYLAVGLPAFLVSWVLSIPDGPFQRVKVRQHLPDVTDAFADLGGGR